MAVQALPSQRSGSLFCIISERQDIQSSVTLHNFDLSAFLNTVRLGSSERIEGQLQMLNDNLGGVDHKVESEFAICSKQATTSAQRSENG